MWWQDFTSTDFHNSAQRRSKVGKSREWWKGGVKTDNQFSVVSSLILTLSEHPVMLE